MKRDEQFYNALNHILDKHDAAFKRMALEAKYSDYGSVLRNLMLKYEDIKFSYGLQAIGHFFSGWKGNDIGFVDLYKDRATDSREKAEAAYLAAQEILFDKEYEVVDMLNKKDYEALHELVLQLDGVIDKALGDEKEESFEAKKELSTPEKHQLKIAKSTLKASDVGAKILGGMTKDEARTFLKKIGWSEEKIAKLEEREMSVEQAKKVLAMSEQGAKLLGDDMEAFAAWKEQAREVLKKAGEEVQERIDEAGSGSGLLSIVTRAMKDAAQGKKTISKEAFTDVLRQHEDYFSRAVENLLKAEHDIVVEDGAFGEGQPAYAPPKPPQEEPTMDDDIKPTPPPAPPEGGPKHIKDAPPKF